MKRMVDNKEFEELKNNVDDINTNKLPQYVKKQIDDETYHTYIINENNDDNRDASLQYSNVTDENNYTNYSVGVNSVLGAFMAIYKKVSGVESSHVLTFDENGDLKIDGNAVGGSTLYQHNICLSDTSDAFKLFLHITNDVSTKYTNASDVFNYIYNKGFVWEEGITYQKNLFGCSGWVFNENNEFIQVDSFIMISATQIKAYGFKGSMVKGDLNVNISTFTNCKDII